MSKRDSVYCNERLLPVLVAGFVLIACSDAFGQSEPRFEIGGNVTSTNVNTWNFERGWSGEFVANVVNGIGVTVIYERSWQTAPTITRLTQGTRLPGGTSFLQLADALIEPRTTVVWFGGRGSTAVAPRLRTFGRALFGLVSTSAPAEIVPLESYDAARVAARLSDYEDSSSGAAVMLGAGLQFALGRNAAINTAIDWRNMPQQSPPSQIIPQWRRNVVQVSAGFAFRFGAS